MARIRIGGHAQKDDQTLLICCRQKRLQTLLNYLLVENTLER